MAKHQICRQRAAAGLLLCLGIAVAKAAAAAAPAAAAAAAAAAPAAPASNNNKLLLARPARDCLAPSLSSLRSEYDLYPSEYRSVIAAPRAASAPSATVADAADFDIEYYGTYKVVRARRTGSSGSGGSSADGSGATAYVLYQCGTPDPTALPAGAAAGVPPGAASFEIPLVSVAATDATVNGFLAELGVLDRVAYASPYSVAPCLQRVAAAKDAGGCGRAAPDSFVDANDAAAAKAFAAANGTMYAGSDAVFIGYGPATSPKDILFTATADPGPLNRAEWVKYVAAFFNKEVDANRLYNAVKSAYTVIQQRAATARDAPGGAAPRVAWVSANATGVSFRLDAYKTTLITDAGGAPFDRKALAAAGAKLSDDAAYGTAQAFVPLTSAGPALRKLLADADVIIDETYHADGLPSIDAVARSLGFKDAAAARAAAPAFAAGKFYRWDGELVSTRPGAASGWFESAVARPDWVLADLARALQPAAANSAKAGDGAELLSAGPGGARDFNFVTAVGAGDPLGTPRVANVGACGAASNGGGNACAGAGAEPAAICPNAYRDCATGRLVAADPAKRCQQWSACVAEPGAAPTRGVGAAASSAGGQPAAAATMGAALVGGAALLMAL